MRSFELLRADAEYAFARLMEALEGVDQDQAWAVLPATSEEFLHTDGSIQGVVLHVAGGKRMYGSVAFRDTETRWRDVAAEMDRFEPDWVASLHFLRECHRYWMESWSGLSEDELSKIRRIPSGRSMTTWQVIELQNHHDSYHAGQIAILRYAADPSKVPPPSTGDDIRRYCREEPCW